MTDNELLLLRTHIEIHARREPQAVKITEVLQKAVKELENYEKMKNCWNCNNWNWKHNTCDRRLKGECFKASKWELRR